MRTGNATLTSTQLKLLSKVTIGTKLAVYWPDDNEYYPCVVKSHRPTPGSNSNNQVGHRYEVLYDDGENEYVDLSTERFRIIGGKKRQSSDTTANANANANDDGGGKMSSNGGDNKKEVVSSKKKRRILEESEEEFDMDVSSEEEENGGDDDDDDSGSEYKMKGDESSIDESLNAVSEKEEDDWLASEDEDEDEAPQKKKKKVAKKVTITHVGGGGSKKVSPTPMKTSGAITLKKKKGESKDIDFDMYLSQTPKKAKSTGSSTAKKQPVAAKKSVITQSSSPVPNQTQKLQQQQQSANIPKPQPGAVNPAGSHMHNHLKFFTTKRKDIHGHPVDHPDFSQRTLKLDLAELSRNGSKVTPAQQQWWDIKSQYADTVLLFKTGKFYEMFHDDADVGVAVLGFNYMKGESAHAGFPEAAYGQKIATLVERGYKVARVEQTETPADMAERKKRAPKGKKPSVVCREVCSIMTKGTRTFCYLDDVSLLETGQVNTGPLIVIKEIMVEEDSNSNKDGMDVDGDKGEAGGTKAVCEYGVTIVDAVTGVVTLGQFADDILRSRMQTLLASFGPSEVSYL